jgi:hypothetical protein
LRIFIDTEFTDFVNPELISIGLISECGNHEFYAELPVNVRRCNEFVIKTVLPQLAKSNDAQYSLKRLTSELSNWLLQFQLQDAVICFDYVGDWTLFCYAMNYEIPQWLRYENIYVYLNDRKLEEFFIKNNLRSHHALNDAKANRFAFEPLRKK